MTTTQTHPQLSRFKVSMKGRVTHGLTGLDKTCTVNAATADAACQVAEDMHYGYRAYAARRI